MSKVITFSRNFPAYHPKAGQPTWFVEKIWQSCYENGIAANYNDDLKFELSNWINPNFKITKKIHTIRSGNRWKAGDKFSPRVWSGKPYCSKQIAIAPDLELVRVYDFEIERNDDYYCILIDGNVFHEWNLCYQTQIDAFETIAKNDGLLLEDMKAWFKVNDKKFTGFKGQILCWIDPNY